MVSGDVFIYVQYNDTNEIWKGIFRFQIFKNKQQM